MFWRRKRNVFDRPQVEPLFIAIADDDPDMLHAYGRAAETFPTFHTFVRQPGSRQCCAKLRFRDPEGSVRAGEDVFVFLWLASVVHHDDKNLYSGVFFELPPELQRWHSVGQRIGFEADEVFDWFVNDDGHLHGGFTLRVARSHLPPGDRASYDRYIGVSSWEPRP